VDVEGEAETVAMVLVRISDARPGTEAQCAAVARIGRRFRVAWRRQAKAQASWGGGDGWRPVDEAEDETKRLDLNCG
jgi:hypothetical protein